MSTRLSAERMLEPSGAVTLALDLGKSRCRARLLRDGRTSEEAGPGAPGLAGAGGAARAEAAILAVALPLLRRAGVAEVERAGVSAAGALAAPAAAAALASRLCGSLPARRVMVCSDATAAHAGALSGRPGVVLAIGTGAAAVAVGADGVTHRADGWGSWLGDEGGGAWLGLQGLRAALRHHDGSGPATLLRAAAEARFGPLPAIAADMEGSASPARLAATFAPDVAEAARGGDAIATALMEHAARALAATTGAAAARMRGDDPCPVAITGGLTELGPVLLDRLVAALPLRLRHCPPDGSPLDGAILLARDSSTIHEQAVHRAEPAPSLRLLDRLARRRALRMLQQSSGAPADAAAAVTESAGYRVKTALVALIAGVDTATAERLLHAAGGRVRNAIAHDGG